MYLYVAHKCFVTEYHLLLSLLISDGLVCLKPLTYSHHSLYVLYMLNKLDMLKLWQWFPWW